jgi:hypothetical protein
MPTEASTSLGKTVLPYEASLTSEVDTSPLGADTLSYDAGMSLDEVSLPDFYSFDWNQNVN